MATGKEGLAARLRAFRLAAGLTQEQLAERASLRQSNVTGIERGVIRNPRLDTLRALAGALGVSLDELAGPPEG